MMMKGFGGHFSMSSLAPLSTVSTLIKLKLDMTMHFGALLATILASLLYAG